MAERPETTSLSRPASGDEHARLVAQLGQARNRLAADLNGLGEAVNVTHRLQNSVRRNPALWIGGGIAAGILAASLIRTPRGRAPFPRQAPKSLFFGLLGLAGKEILRQSGPGIARFAQENVDRWIHQEPPQNE